jgi:hypothetical protein
VENVETNLHRIQGSLGQSHRARRPLEAVSLKKTKQFL